MIPKVIHYCWFGHNPLPPLALKCIASWRKYMPEYEIREWNEDNFDVHAVAYTREAYHLHKYAFVSDYARFWILYHYGGLYFDTDVELIQPLHDLIARGPFMGIEAGTHLPQGLGVAPGLGLGVNPGLGLYREVLDYYATHHFASWTGRFTGTVVGITTAILARHPEAKAGDGVVQRAGIYIYPPDVFCPMDYATGQLQLTPRTRSIHHYAATWTVSHETFLDRVRRRLGIALTRLTVGLLGLK